MDPSTCSESAPPNPGFSSMTIQQNEIPLQKSPALKGCGITLIVTSTLCLIPLSVLCMTPMSNVASVWFMFDVLYLLMAMHCVYAGGSVAERRHVVVSTMIMGILATVGTVPFVIGFCVAISFLRGYSVVATAAIFSFIFSIINSVLAIAIAVIACQKTCDCCKPAFHPMDRQPLTSDIA